MILLVRIYHWCCTDRIWMPAMQPNPLRSGGFSSRSICFERISSHYSLNGSTMGHRVQFLVEFEPLPYIAVDTADSSTDEPCRTLGSYLKEKKIIFRTPLIYQTRLYALFILLQFVIDDKTLASLWFKDDVTVGVGPFFVDLTRNAISSVLRHAFQSQKHETKQTSSVGIREEIGCHEYSLRQNHRNLFAGKHQTVMRKNRHAMVVFPWFETFNSADTL